MWLDDLLDAALEMQLERALQLHAGWRAAFGEMDLRAFELDAVSHPARTGQGWSCRRSACGDDTRLP
jgi:hypothetical protein